MARSRYYFRPGHPKANERGFVEQADLGFEFSAEARFAPIMMDRHYENMAATDGTDIGSRRKHREYMKQNGLTVSADFSPAYYEAQRTREQREVQKDRRESVARAAYEVLDRRK